MGKRLAMYIVATLAAILAFGVFFTTTSYFKKDMTAEDSVRIDEHASVQINDKIYEDATLSGIVFDPLPAGSKVRYTIPMPDQEMNKPMLTLYIIHSLARVYLDDELIYSYGEDKGEMKGYGHVSFPIEDRYIGKQLRVEYDVLENGEFASFEPPTLTDNGVYFYRNNADKFIHQYFLDMALIMLSLSIAGVSLFFMIRDPEMSRLVYLALSIFGMGLWVMCNYELIYLFTDNLALKGYLEYLSFYIAPFFFTLYFADDFYHREQTFRKYVYLGILTAQGIFIAASVMLHFTGTLHLPRILPVNHILIVTAFAFLIYMSIRSLRKKEYTHKPFLIGFLILVVFCMRDLILFVNFYYIGHNHGEKYESRMLSGVFLFAISMFIDFFSVHTKRRAVEARNEILGHMAYTDTMTGLNNRRKGDEELAKLSDNPASNVFGIINFDLNDLKKTNDNYGHEAGDKLLIDFSTLLADTFRDNCICCRMGGDEFLVIIPDESKVDTKALLGSMHEACNKINETRTPLPLSFAYGYSTNTDSEVAGLSGMDLVREVFKCSDKRMYDNKMAIKGR